MVRSHGGDEAELLRREQAVELPVGELELANSVLRHVSEHAAARASASS